MGSELTLQIKGFRRSILDVQCASNPEQLELELKLETDGKRSDNLLDQIAEFKEKTLMNKRGHSYTQHGVILNKNNVNENLQADIHVIARVPPKFFNLEIDAEYCTIDVDRVTDADWLYIKSHGGDVHLRSPKIATVNCITQGGSITGSVTGGFVVLCSGDGPTPNSAPSPHSQENARGGNINMKNISCRELFLSTATEQGSSGNSDIGALYADSASIVTRAFNCGTLSCSNTAHVDAEDTAVVGGIDGNASLRSANGGDIRVFLNANAENIKIESPGGDVDLSLDATTRAALHVSGASRCSLPTDANNRSTVLTDDKITAFLEPDSIIDDVKLQSRLHRGVMGPQNASNIEIVVAGTKPSSTGGIVTVKRSSWLEQVLSRKSEKDV